MNGEKLSALENLVTMPKDLPKLLLYENKLKETCTLLIFDCRKIILNIINTNNVITPINKILQQVKTKVDLLIDKARSDILQIRPGTQDKIRKTILNNCILYNFIIFSRAWDLKEALKDLDTRIVFNEKERTESQIKVIFEHINIIDELFTSKNHVKTHVQDSEDIAQNLNRRFNQELELAEQAGALKGIVSLKKPKVLGKSKYYDQLGNLILKVAFSFGLEHADEPISILALTNRLNDYYPNVRAEPKDVIKAIEILAQNGFLILNQSYEGTFWISLKPSESEANTILALAEKSGSLTIEELVKNTGWSIDKASAELDKFVVAGCAVKDSSYVSGITYFFPGLVEDDSQFS